MKTKRNEEAQEHLRVFREIMDYVRDNPGTSYYDVKAKAYEDENEEWINLLKSRQTRASIAQYIKSHRKSTGVKYKHTIDESLATCVAAMKKYEQKQIDIMMLAAME